MHHPGIHAAGMHLVVPGKRAKRTRPGTHYHRRTVAGTLELNRGWQQTPVVMGPGSRFAWPGRRAAV